MINSVKHDLNIFFKVPTTNYSKESVSPAKNLGINANFI